jgi:hypothetical protein
MGIKHTVPAGLPTGSVAGLLAGDDWRADHVHVPFEATMVLLTTATAPAAVSAAANTEAFSAAKLTRTKIDLSQATQARLIGMVIVAGNVVGASLKLSYMTTEAATWAGTDAGPVCVLGTNGGVAGVLHDSGWTSLAAGARVDNCTVAALVGTAFGTTAPTISSLYVLFK